jgi:hypothetical protein
MVFGLHEWLPEPTTYVTVLRHPIARAVSEYQFLCQRPAHPLNPKVRELSLAEFLRSGLTRQLSNGQTRLLSGASDPGDPGVSTWRPMTEADLERAIDHLERYFSVVGIQERFEETVLLMCRVLGWRRWRVRHRNATVPMVEPTAQDRAQIESLNLLDLRLYEWARVRFDEAVRAAGSLFPVQRLMLRVRSWSPRSG